MILCQAQLRDRGLPTVNLETEKNGYSKSQVNAYIAMFSEQYDKLRKEYDALLEKNRELTAALENEKANTIKLQSHTPSATTPPQPPSQTPDTEAVGKALVEAQIIAKQITDRARIEASQATNAANAELSKAMSAKEQIIKEVESILALLKGNNNVDKSPEPQERKYEQFRPEELL